MDILAELGLCADQQAVGDISICPLTCMRGLVYRVSNALAHGCVERKFAMRMQSLSANHTRNGAILVADIIMNPCSRGRLVPMIQGNRMGILQVSPPSRGATRADNFAEDLSEQYLSSCHSKRRIVPSLRLFSWRFLRCR
jgi:hypothetical protein